MSGLEPLFVKTSLIGEVEYVKNFIMESEEVGGVAIGVMTS